LASLIDDADRMHGEEIEKLGDLARRRIESEYSWDRVVGEYEGLFV
jgi:glycosyltransferase involved in cell wall biosynthesis